MSWMEDRRLSFFLPEFMRMKYFWAWLATCACGENSRMHDTVGLLVMRHDRLTIECRSAEPPDRHRVLERGAAGDLEATEAAGIPRAQLPAPWETCGCQACQLTRKPALPSCSNSV